MTDTQKEVDKQIAEHTKTIIGVDLTPFYRAADIQDEVDLNITANVSLIKSIPQQYADKLEVLITNALQTGQTNEELVKLLSNWVYLLITEHVLLLVIRWARLTTKLTKLDSFRWVLRHTHGKLRKMSVCAQIININRARHLDGIHRQMGTSRSAYPLSLHGIT